MPTHKSAWKRMRQNEKRRVRKKAHRSFLRKAIRSFKALDDADSAKDQYPGVVSVIDRSVQKGIIHHRKASRMKSRLSRRMSGS